MSDELPAPPVPADADLTHYDNMPLEVRRLRDSGIAGIADAEAFRCGVIAWCVAWHQIPAGSLPNDDVELCRLVGLGRDHRTWKRVRAGALRGWRMFADGRLYHPVVTEKVIQCLNSTRATMWARECDRLRKENRHREKQKLDPLEFPPKPEPLTYGWPADFPRNSAGKPTAVPPETDDIPAENALKGREGKGKEEVRVLCVSDTREPDPDWEPEGHQPQQRQPQPASYAKRIPADWEPSDAVRHQLATARPDITPSMLERRMLEFRSWCSETNKVTHNPDATWLSFMVKTHVQRSSASNGGLGDSLQALAELSREGSG